MALHNLVEVLMAEGIDYLNATNGRWIKKCLNNRYLECWKLPQHSGNISEISI